MIRTADISNAIRDEEEAIKLYKKIEDEIMAHYDRGRYVAFTTDTKVVRVLSSKLLHIISSIRKDEEKHKKYLENIYKVLTTG